MKLVQGFLLLHSESRSLFGIPANMEVRTLSVDPTLAATAALQVLLTLAVFRPVAASGHVPLVTRPRRRRTCLQTEPHFQHSCGTFANAVGFALSGIDTILLLVAVWTRLARQSGPSPSRRDRGQRTRTADPGRDHARDDSVRSGRQTRERQGAGGCRRCGSRRQDPPRQSHCWRARKVSSGRICDVPIRCRGVLTLLSQFCRPKAQST